MLQGGGPAQGKALSLKWLRCWLVCGEGAATAEPPLTGRVWGQGAPTPVLMGAGPACAPTPPQ